MQELSRHMGNRGCTIFPESFMCGNRNTREHAWECHPTHYEADKILQQMRQWLKTHWCRQREETEYVEKELGMLSTWCGH